MLRLSARSTAGESLIVGVLLGITAAAVDVAVCTDCLLVMTIVSWMWESTQASQLT
ncbi:hypothetical protein NITLEN_40215 [Nitrospira lenta]|uniref:Uncharacterized protein n=1 Tax=Nitrospira lenta TaxID=1436998 RepID=A0A330L7T7_9BACT|nr:hypothetical protein NITLEN_40215 [Nitrospira lenta]